MGLLLNLETATTNCSVCLAKDGQILTVRENNTPNYSHAEQLHVFIKECMEEAGYELSALDAIAISKGPGSYTGLRIGVSAAKGLCYALDKPLISIATLKSMASQIDVMENEIIIPVLDARRMEVYAAIFDSELNQIRETKAEIIEPDSFSDYLEYQKVHFVGSGAEKIKSVLNKDNLVYHSEIVPSANDMAILSNEKLNNRDFEDVAYFEPYYLKDFILTTKKK
ncbi:tRNA (adenosine(37)-N6)-threonylcarbamoyltransferase complex dimerization subunit type 1 TsaB [Maribacter sp. CXY002]|uniref:tRNA (adenosine(37)-N6)-threonylcarbamoyltransferase complex dimerization subunit type 1 TsaB n=1 Tax=Maribacter luteocoastalis TaxID=3407671 RepID=UPI003B66D7F3